MAEETLPLPSGDSPQAQIHSVPSDDLIVLTGECSAAGYVLCIPADNERIPTRFAIDGDVYEIKRVATPNTEG